MAVRRPGKKASVPQKRHTICTIVVPHADRLSYHCGGRPSSNPDTAEQTVLRRRRQAGATGRRGYRTAAHFLVAEGRGDPRGCRGVRWTVVAGGRGRRLRGGPRRRDRRGMRKQCIGCDESIACMGPRPVGIAICARTAHESGGRPIDCIKAAVTPRHEQRLALGRSACVIAYRRFRRRRRIFSAPAQGRSSRAGPVGQQLAFAA